MKMIDSLRKPKISWLLVLLLIPSLILNIYLFQKGKTSDQGILVMEVLDGDTLLLEGKVRLRLRNLDAPELEYCGGEESKEFLEELVKDKKIIISEKILDQRGRALALVYQGEVLVNEKLLENGLARFHLDQSTQADFLKQVSQNAKDAKLGIFSPQCYQTENLENPDCRIKGNIDKNAPIPKAKKYYFPGCTQYEFTIVEKDIGEGWFCSEEEAQKAGFEKAKSCFDKKYKPEK